MMRAVQKTAPGQVSVREVARPEPAPGEVLVEVVAAGICATDRKFTDRDHDPLRILGHEVTGRLVDGTPVGVHPEITCQQCPACQAGWHNRCPERQSLGLSRDGGLAEWLAVPAAQLVPLAGVDPITGAMLEPLACVVHAIEISLPAAERSSPAVVVGAGPMGIMCAWALQAAGAPVALCQRSSPRRQLARDLGIKVVIGPDSDPAEVLGQPPVAAIVTAPGAEPLSWALARVAVGGVVHAFAGSPGGAQIDANPIHYRHLRLVGSTGSRRADYRRARDLVAAGQIPLAQLPHQVIKLAVAPAAVRNGPAGGALKTVVAVS